MASGTNYLEELATLSTYTFWLNLGDTSISINALRVANNVKSSLYF